MDLIFYGLIAIVVIAAVWAVVAFGLSRAQDREQHDLETSVAIEEVDESGPLTEVHRTEGDEELEEQGLDQVDEHGPNRGR